MVSAGLVPVGAYCLYSAHSHGNNQTYWPFALYPLFFGIQQAVEGWLWLMLEAGNSESIRLSALGYVFFSHFFWLLWIPYSCYSVETGYARKRLLFVLILAGMLFGLAMYIPVLLFSDWMVVSVVNHSISYELRLLFDDFVPRVAVRGAYILVVLIPLLSSSHIYLRHFGILIMLSIVLVIMLFPETFISVWCFFAAVISCYMLYMFISLEKQKALHY